MPPKEPEIQLFGAKKCKWPNVKENLRSRTSGDGENTEDNDEQVAAGGRNFF